LKIELLPPLYDNLVRSKILILFLEDEGGFGDHSGNGKEFSKT